MIERAPLSTIHFTRFETGILAAVINSHSDREVKELDGEELLSRMAEASVGSGEFVRSNQRRTFRGMPLGRVGR